MLNGAELTALSGWCSRRNLQWTMHGRDGDPAVMLEPKRRTASTQCLTLVLGEDDMWLENEQGERLASASDLPALLDALDGGVGEPDPPGSARGGGWFRADA